MSVSFRLLLTDWLNFDVGDDDDDDDDIRAWKIGRWGVEIEIEIDSDVDAVWMLISI